MLPSLPAAAMPCCSWASLWLVWRAFLACDFAHFQGRICSHFGLGPSNLLHPLDAAHVALDSSGFGWVCARLCRPIVVGWSLHRCWGWARPGHVLGRKVILGACTLQVSLQVTLQVSLQVSPILGSG
eukprot:6486017-Prymnesium_polylepis.1